ncbi:MAG TPA: Na+/H+ antiporter NhaA [Terriglobia bacterium]|nr:Na+/H+ antiporter NhaA [Terriglobia bacterium]
MRRSVKRVLAPVERFLAIEAASGILLMLTAAVALVWANSPWQTSYADLWHIPLGFTFGGYGFERDLHFWINDGLMTIFFFVVGLEIRREVHAGELSELRRAALPVAAALGGMLVPASIFFFFNAGRASASGWAVPMATDIAFAVGALALLGKRVAPALRILLLALAVIDDVGAILVIALFYSSTLNGLGFVVFGLGIVGIFLLQVLGIRLALVYVAPAIVIWTGAYIAGIHPTLAGVVVGLMTPATAWYDTAGLLHKIETGIRSLRDHDVSGDRGLIPHLDALKTANREAVSPVERLQHQLHGWVAFGIMPLFAFANAGVPLGQISFDGDALWVFCGVGIGLMFGKPIGILAVSWIAVRLRLAALPTGVGWSHIAVVGMVGGIGFTMALFIAQLAFPAGPLLETAKLAILCGSALAGVLALLVGKQVLQVLQSPGAALNEADAESSTIH